MAEPSCELVTAGELDGEDVELQLQLLVIDTYAELDCVGLIVSVCATDV